MKKKIASVTSRKPFFLFV